MSDERSKDDDKKWKRQYRLFAIDEHGNLRTGELFLNEEIFRSAQNSPSNQDSDLPFDIDFQKILREAPNEGSRPVGAQGAGIHVVSKFDAYRTISGDHKSANNEGYLQCIRCRHPYALDESMPCECGRN
ncbi:MAG: hypothetical protein IH867_05165 [Chloroflexi bacterium]|nr:hypothetical protein [Chloroflexota bacterium]